MQHRPTRILAAAALAALACLALPARAEVTVIINAANAVVLDDEAIANLFLGQAKAFPGGLDAAPVNQKADSPAAQEFATKVLKKTPAQLRAFWAKQVFTGGGKPPKELDGDDAVLKHVAATPGGIGYVESGKLGPGVRALRK